MGDPALPGGPKLERTTVRQGSRKLLLAVTLAFCCLPLGAGAETPTGGPGGKQAGAATRAATGAHAAPAGTQAEEKLQGATARIRKVTAQGIVMQRAGTTTDPSLPAFFVVKGGAKTRVSGQGKNRWMELRRGDLVFVSYVDGAPREARSVNVLKKPLPVDPMIALAAGIKPKVPSERTFIGYIKKVDGDLLDVMRPAPPPPTQRPAEIKRFVRQESTRVEVLRTDWKDLHKGDRVKIEFQKGDPRPVDLVQVIWRGGEKPLPPGVATRLFDPAYDKSVRDVDGIGETGPIPPVGRRTQPLRIKGIPQPK